VDAQVPAAPPKLELTDEQREAWVGQYSSEELGVRYAIAATESGLSVAIPGQESLPLDVLAPDRVGAQGVELRLERDAQGRSSGFALDAGRVRDLHFVRVN
jgi:hypothetical protein